ncbi:MAG: Queuosine biosynthesis protein queC [Pseudomonadota bacterium]
MTHRAVVLLSGGLDSSTCLAWGIREGMECHALSFNYGQRQLQELKAARAIATALGASSHRVLDIDLRAIGGSALTDDIAVPKHRTIGEIGQGIPITYVPARNTIFLSHALALAEVIGADRLVIGVNALDYSGYPDCRPEFIAAFESMANLGSRFVQTPEASLQILTPLIAMTKAEIVRLARSLDVPIELTFSCYDPSESGNACGHCDACVLRAKGLEEA